MTKPQIEAAFTLVVAWGAVLVLIVAAALLLAGCVASNATQLMEAAAKYRQAQGDDTRSWCLKDDLSTVYGTNKLRLAVTGLANGDVSCTDDGLTVKTQPQGITIPVTVVPQVQMGVPLPTHPAPPPRTVPRSYVPNGRLGEVLEGIADMNWSGKQ